MYGHVQCIYTILANPNYAEPVAHADSRSSDRAQVWVHMSMSDGIRINI
jgi:hypothetical protein